MYTLLQGLALQFISVKFTSVRQNTPLNRKDLGCLWLQFPTWYSLPFLEFVIFPPQPLESQGYQHLAPGGLWFGVPLSSKPEFVGACF